MNTDEMRRQRELRKAHGERMRRAAEEMGREHEKRDPSADGQIFRADTS